MAEPGLTTRLRQHSRRSGMMVGLSMAITIAIVIVAFIWIYLRLTPFVSDFIPSDPVQTPAVRGAAASPTALPTVAAAAATEASASPAPTGTATANVTRTAAPTTTAATTPVPTVSWQATHKISPDRPDINFRAGPSTVADIVGVLAPGTELKFLGETQSTGGLPWMKFQTKDGKVGWVRQIDVVTVNGANP